MRATSPGSFIVRVGRQIAQEPNRRSRDMKHRTGPDGASRQAALWSETWKTLVRICAEHHDRSLVLAIGAARLTASAYASGDAGAPRLAELTNTLLAARDIQLSPPQRAEVRAKAAERVCGRRVHRNSSVAAAEARTRQRSRRPRSRACARQRGRRVARRSPGGRRSRSPSGHTRGGDEPPGSSSHTRCWSVPGVQP